jgi:hypothetical protein
LWRFQIPEDLCRRYGYPRLTPSIKRKILGLNSARLYKLPVGTVERPGEHEGEGEEHGEKRAIYTPVPRDYASRITPELKRILEFPTTGAAAPQSPLPHYANDNLEKIKQSYAELGGTRSNTRYGWLRTRT